MASAIVLIADGFEEMEFAYPVSVLRSAGVNVRVVTINSNLNTNGAHGVSIVADETFDNAHLLDADVLIIPGGQPGTDNLLAFSGMKEILDYYFKNKIVAAICAAPIILGKYECIDGRKMTCYPGYEKSLNRATILKDPVVVDGNIITANGPGSAKIFALEIAKTICPSFDYEKVKEHYGE